MNLSQKLDESSTLQNLFTETQKQNTLEELSQMGHHHISMGI